MKAEQKCSECEELQSSPHGFNCQVFAGRVAQPAESRIVDPVGAGSTPAAPATPDTMTPERFNELFQQHAKETFELLKKRKTLAHPLLVAKSQIRPDELQELKEKSDRPVVAISGNPAKAIVEDGHDGGLMTYMQLMEELGVENPGFKDQPFVNDLPLDPQFKSELRHESRRYFAWIDPKGNQNWFQFKSLLELHTGMKRIFEVFNGTEPEEFEVVGGWDLGIMKHSIRKATFFGAIPMTCEERTKYETKSIPNSMLNPSYKVRRGNETLS